MIDLPGDQALTGVLRRIADQVGLPAALTLAHHFGGVRLYVPRTLPPDHLLVRLLGYEAAGKLAEIYGGSEHFDVPRGALAELLALRRERDRTVIALLDAGKSVRDVAREFRLAERTVRRIRRRAEAAGTRTAPASVQAELFDA